MCLKLTIKTQGQRHFGVFTVSLEHISHIFLVFLFLAWNKYMFAGLA